MTEPHQTAALLVAVAIAAVLFAFNTYYEREYRRLKERHEALEHERDRLAWIVTIYEGIDKVELDTRWAMDRAVARARARRR